MQHQGAGPDPRVNPADEVKQKAERGYPGPGGAGCGVGGGGEGAVARNAADFTDGLSPNAILSDTVRP